MYFSEAIVDLIAVINLINYEVIFHKLVMHSNFMSYGRIVVSIFYKYEREISSLAMGETHTP